MCVCVILCGHVASVFICIVSKSACTQEQTLPLLTYHVGVIQLDEHTTSIAKYPNLREPKLLRSLQEQACRVFTVQDDKEQWFWSCGETNLIKCSIQKGEWKEWAREKRGLARLLSLRTQRVAAVRASSWAISSRIRPPPTCMAMSCSCTTESSNASYLSYPASGSTRVRMSRDNFVSKILYISEQQLSCGIDHLFVVGVLVL